LTQLGTLLPFEGFVAEAEQVFEKAISLCEEHGDRIHLMATYFNRRPLWLAMKNIERAVEDTMSAAQIAREIGLVTAAFAAEYNLGEIFYQAADPDAAWPHVQRALELEEKRLTGYDRPLARLLEARLLTYLGRDAEARRVIDEMLAYQADAERAGKSDSLLIPSEQVLLRLVDLCTREATDAEWAELHARSQSASMEQEPIEVAEMAARAFVRRGQMEHARRMLDEATARAQKIPNMMETRLAQARASLQAGAVSRAG
jgi:tetratricopeptide (TPR) repeat protein